VSVLRVRGVGRSFGGHRVLTGVDLDVDEGEIVVLLGRSGSGKTTLLTIVTGFDAPDEGTVERPGTAWREVAVLPQSLGLLPELTVGENVALPLRVAGEEEGPTAPLLDRLGLAHLAHRLPAETSLGEQQRTALARAVVLHPKLVVADEPVSHQNRSWAEAMMALLRELADAGTACILATHDEVAVAAADRVVQLHDGRLTT
jgi:putative ABC transport system ATP-binding protein